MSKFKNKKLTYRMSRKDHQSGKNSSTDHF